MVFAFAAAASLFDASIRWESRSSNMRKAALIAERKMEELRGRSRDIPGVQSFDAHMTALIAGPHPPYNDAPGFIITVTELPNIHQEIPSNNLTPSDGVHSPCSLFYTTPVPAAPPNQPHPSDLPPRPGIRNGDAQRNRRYDSYPYSRPMPLSYKLVKVEVEYGAGGLVGQPRNFELISLIGDPILPPDRPAENRDLTVQVTGPASGTLSTGNPSIDLGLLVTTASGSVVEDVSAIWSITPTSTGDADLYTMNANGTQCRLLHGPLARSGTDVTIQAQVRYGGIEAIGFSPTFRVAP